VKRTDHDDHHSDHRAGAGAGRGNETVERRERVWKYVLRVLLAIFFALYRHPGLRTAVLDWLARHLPVQIIPFIANAFSIYLFYSYFQSIPRDLDEAARVDGAGWFRIYRSVIMPLAGRAIATVAILTFLPAWNSNLWPLMLVQTEELRPCHGRRALLPATERPLGSDHGLLDSHHPFRCSVSSSPSSASSLAASRRPASRADYRWRQRSQRSPLPELAPPAWQDDGISVCQLI
jgi:hypothetical protein